MYSNLNALVNGAHTKGIDARGYKRNYDNSIIDVFVTIMQVQIVNDEYFDYDEFEELEEYEED